MTTGLPGCAMRYRERAICLRVMDYSETSQVASFLTRGAGLVRLLAKGSKRPKSKTGGALDLLSEGELIFTTSGSGGLGTLIEFTDERSHQGLRQQAHRLFVSAYMLELAEAMLGELDPHPEVFDLLHNSLARLGQSDSPVQAVLAWYQWRLLRHTGLLGELTRCVVCGQAVEGLVRGEAAVTQEVYFSSRLGGLVCRDCEASATEKYRLSGLLLDALGRMHAVEMGRKTALPHEQARALNAMLGYHIREQLGKPLRWARYALGSLKPS